MTRGIRDDDRRPGRGGGDASLSIDDEMACGRSRGGNGEDGPVAQRRRLRDDPCGRRSLTGLEFKRQRSA